MAENDAKKPTEETFTELLFNNGNVNLDTDGCYNYNTSFSPETHHKMLCFGESECSLISSNIGKVTQEGSQVACNNLPKPKRKRNGSADKSSPADYPTNRRRERSNFNGQGKVKKEKIGERIAALQQLVSPYGKSDTASVLHEAMGYIKFLQDQVQVLCSPYLQYSFSALLRAPYLSFLLRNLYPSQVPTTFIEAGDVGDGYQVRKDLKSMGLCLVPVECTSVLANDNGADYWSPAMSKNFIAN